MPPTVHPSHQQTHIWVKVPMVGALVDRAEVSASAANWTFFQQCHAEHQRPQPPIIGQSNHWHQPSSAPYQSLSQGPWPLLLAYLSHYRKLARAMAQHGNIAYQLRLHQRFVLPPRPVCIALYKNCLLLQPKLLAANSCLHLLGLLAPREQLLPLQAMRSILQQWSQLHQTAMCRSSYSLRCYDLRSQAQSLAQQRAPMQQDLGDLLPTNQQAHSDGMDAIGSRHDQIIYRLWGRLSAGSLSHEQLQ